MLDDIQRFLKKHARLLIWIKIVKWLVVLAVFLLNRATIL